MENVVYQFHISAMDTAKLLPQVSCALEKRTELISRARFPDLWKRTDKLHASVKGKTRSRRRAKLLGIVNVVLFGFLILTELLGQQRPLPLIVGGIAIAVGTLVLCSSGKTNKNRFDKSAKKLLEQKNTIVPGQFQVLFSAIGVELHAEAEGTSEVVVYDDFEYVIETADLFLLTFKDRVTVLQKQELSNGSVDDFRSFLLNKVKLVNI